MKKRADIKLHCSIMENTILKLFFFCKLQGPEYSFLGLGTLIPKTIVTAWWCSGLGPQRQIRREWVPIPLKEDITKWIFSNSKDAYAWFETPLSLFIGIGT
jgi:hypothetical protein